jgi:hypothetical protein
MLQEANLSVCYKMKEKTKTEVDEFDKCVIYRTVNEYHFTEGQHPILILLLPVLEKNIYIQGSMWVLWHIVSKLGFR